MARSVFVFVAITISMYVINIYSYTVATRYRTPGTRFRAKPSQCTSPSHCNDLSVNMYMYK